MKKTIVVLMLLFISGIAIISCNKKSSASVSPANTVFYLSTNCQAGPETITINGVSKQVTYIFTNGSVPNCGDPNTASFELPAGAYTYTVKDSASTRTGSVTVAANVCNIVNVACDTFSISVRNVISEVYIDSLTNWGMTIHGGLTPPTDLTGIYVFSPNILLHPFGPGDYAPGQLFADYKYKFYNQVNNSIDVALKDIGGSSDTASGIAGYVSGTDNSFSIFGQVSGVSNSIPYTEVLIFTGIMTSTGVQNMQEGFIITGKTGDDNNTVLIPVGTGRVFYDGDYISGISSTFRLAAPLLTSFSGGTVNGVKK